MCYHAPAATTPTVRAPFIRVPQRGAWRVSAEDAFCVTIATILIVTCTYPNTAFHLTTPTTIKDSHVLALQVEQSRQFL